MNKNEMIKVVANKIDGATQKDIAVVVDTIFDTITDALYEGKKVAIIGFGSFEVVERAARIGRNPKDGSEIQIPASKAPKFKAGKALKDAVNA